MDKSFNDQELSDIMKEIEALEEEFSGDTEQKAAPTAVMEELSELEEEKAIPVTNKNDSVIPFDRKTQSTKATSGQHSSMMFKVQGNMTLELQFEIGGKTVMLDVTESGMSIHMDGGVTFTVPVSDTHSGKKAV